MVDDKERNAESKRILDRVSREAGGDAVAGASRMVRRVGDHVAARDVGDDDRIETIGTRIGRILGMVITIGLFLAFFYYLVRG